MTSEQWDKVVELFHEASDKQPEERTAFLEEASGGDASLRKEVETLLREDENSGDFLVESPFGGKALDAVLPKVELGEVDHYTLIEKVGEGGMGTVYKAWDHKLGRLVALKFLSSRMHADEEMKLRFLQEARATSSLDHPNICTIYDIQETSGGRSYIAMAFYEGRTLRQEIDIGVIAPTEAVEIAIQVAVGLAKAHQVGIIHRDLKPANVIITPDKTAKVLDFGIAKLGGGQGLTKTGATVGTVSYMSPEQACGRSIDQRTDVWSLGVLLYEMLTGNPPFRAENELGVLYAIVNEDPQPVNTTQTEWPVGMSDVLHRALEKDVALRYQSMDEMKADLQALQSGGEPESAVRRVEHVRESPSIVVLPFANLSRDPDREYFGDGLTEELINAFSHVDGIRVVSRTTAFQFKGKASDVREIGRKLKVRTVLEGSIRTSGGKVRITAQLVNVADGYQIWSGRFDRELDDIFAVQDEIAQTIVDTLRKRFGEKKALVKKPTEDKEAYHLYLKGRHHCENWTYTGLGRGIELFRAALAKDGSFAQAQVGLAEAYLLRGFWGLMPPREAWSEVRSAARQALSIDDELAEAHAAHGAMLAIEDWDWVQAREEFERAIELDPGDSWIRSWYASVYLVPAGRIEEALRQQSRSVELDPLSPSYNAGLAWIHAYLGNLEESERVARDAVELAPSFLENHWVLVSTLLRRNRVDDALRELEITYGIARESSFTLALLVRAMMLAGRDLTSLYYGDGRMRIAPRVTLTEQQRKQLKIILTRASRSSPVDGAIPDCASCGRRQTGFRDRRTTRHSPPEGSALETTVSRTGCRRSGEGRAALRAATRDHRCEGQRSGDQDHPDVARQRHPVEYAHDGERGRRQRGVCAAHLESTWTEASPHKHLQAEQRSAVCREAGGYRRLVPQSTRACSGSLAGREESDPSIGSHTTGLAAKERSRPDDDS